MIFRARDNSDANQAADQLSQLVGERVRKARDLKGLPRRALSEISGVSPRYLAQLEAGEGNISIHLLLRVALALDVRLDWLLGPDDPWSSETLRMAERFRQAAPETQRQVMNLLNPPSPGSLRAGRIALIGLRGAGKSTLGRMAGEALGIPFIELNQTIEAQTGIPAGEIAALYGQDGYRRLEAEAVQRIADSHKNVILAVAGGIISEPDTYNHLLSHFHTIWLKASAAEHMARVLAQGDTRPMAGNPKAMDELHSILKSREPLYAQAEAMLDTSGKEVKTSVAELADLIEQRGFLV